MELCYTLILAIACSGLLHDGLYEGIAVDESCGGIPEQRFLIEESDFGIGGGRSLSLLLQILAPPGLIVIPELTRSAMENAIAQLWKQGYFDRSSR